MGEKGRFLSRWSLLQDFLNLYLYESTNLARLITYSPYFLKFENPLLHCVAKDSFRFYVQSQGHASLSLILPIQFFIQTPIVVALCHN